jgi:HEPN domain-containing protein
MNDENEPAWREQALLLLLKARQDGEVVELALSEPRLSDEVVGYHVQQAAEKCLKAILLAHGQIAPRTHDVQGLLDLVSDAVKEVPSGIVDIRSFMPFAVEYRYQVPPREAVLNRSRAAELSRAVIAWCADEVGA